VNDRLTALAYRLAWKLVRVMPESIAYLLFQAIADRAWRRETAGIQQLEKNLLRVVPTVSSSELREISKNSMRLYLRYWCDSFRIPDWSAERIIAT
jgi:lauroyl/myristoyl acyltransferase